jgi:flagellar basal body-associated protein FliL
MMKSEGKRGNPIVTVILVLIVLILGVAGGMYLSRTADGGFLGTLMGKSPVSYEAEANAIPQQMPLYAAATAPAVNPAGATVSGTASGQVPEAAQAVENSNVVTGDGTLTRRTAWTVLTPPP